jgi:hypothetical protein
MTPAQTAAQARDGKPDGGSEGIVSELVMALAKLRDVLDSGSLRSGRQWRGVSCAASRSTKRRTKRR